MGQSVDTVFAMYSGTSVGNQLHTLLYHTPFGDPRSSSGGMLRNKTSNSVDGMFQYKATDMVMPGPGKLELVFTPDQGKEERLQVFEFKRGGGVGMAMYNTDEVGCHFWGLSSFCTIVCTLIICIC